MLLIDKKLTRVTVKQEKLVSHLYCSVCKEFYPLEDWHKLSILRNMSDSRGACCYPAYACPACGMLFVDIEAFNG